MTLPLVLALALGYALGSIPWGLVLTAAAGLGDIRRIGSGNIGATNVLRTGRKGLAAATLALDALKGAAAVWVAWRLWGRDAGLLAGAGAMLGHAFPVWLRFRGGKGVATAFGVLLTAAWWLGLAAAAVWLAVAFVTRISSAGALAAAAAAPAVALAFGDARLALMALALALFVTYRHAANIRRLLDGTEPRIGKGA
ncbi:glycerol-3-phosphate 1-O-acyltransferase PlsY [Caldovatus aquaticus]|uniref:Glycerol-3-phosphate acyltransferase n=1 Tax=Caldovatus aquaticus TaxID=2865671 RepID=A0ABS7EXM0_9PROT|nr:glycerol-3-phosphate 1-O-acyltransferase PlsY [Caldovatus aquaticus]MBW8268113.1 glycerol-3-phosphate 1-O-acyltransferase PlsY [Caldovatus aquaticus]